MFGDGTMSCHDSLNLREVVTLPINYEDTLSPCRDKPGSIASASEALPPLVGYRPGASGRVGLNPPETFAARRTVRAIKTEEVKKVQKYPQVYSETMFHGKAHLIIL